MNSFSTVFKRRVITLSIAILCATGFCAPSDCEHTARTKIKLRRAMRSACLSPWSACRFEVSKTQEKSAICLYRGAQPRGDGYEELKKLGISIVVDLRNSKPVKRDGGETREQVKVEAAGMRYVEIPTSAFFGPSQVQVATFLQLLRDNEKQKIFVHCYFGDDRTGVMVATYRIAVDHWTSDEAYNEMRAYHFHKHLILMGHFVKLFPGGIRAQPGLCDAAAGNRHGGAPRYDDSGCPGVDIRFLKVFGPICRVIGRIHRPPLGDISGPTSLKCF